MAEAAAVAAVVDPESAAMVGAGAEAAEQGYQAAKKAAGSGSVSVQEAAGITLTGAAAGSAIMPGIGTAIGALAGLAVSLGVALSDWLAGSGASLAPVKVFDRFAVVKRPARLGLGARRVVLWTLGPSQFERGLQAKKAGKTNLGTLVWMMRRAQEDGGGSAEFRRILGAAGIPMAAVDPSQVSAPIAFEAGQGVAEMWAGLPFVPAAKKRISEPDQVYIGARALGLDVPQARALAGLPRDPAAELFLKDLRARIEQELPPSSVAPPKVTDPRKVSSAVLRHVADLASTAPTLRRIDPSMLRRGVTRSLRMGSGDSGAMPIVLVGLLGLGFFVARRGIFR